MNLKYTYLLLYLVALIFTSCSEKSEQKIFELDSNWEFKSSKENVFITAKVPGTVHLDLINNDKIQDPFYRLNEHELQWIDKLDWDYRTNFNINNHDLNHDNIELEFLGLDTYADVFLNDSLIYTSENMFLGKKVEVKKYIKIGRNDLLIKFKSPINIGIEKHDSLGYSLPDNANDLSEIGKVPGNKKVGVFSRKAPYSFGWDWGPRLVTSGIWRPIQLNFWSNFNIDDIYFNQDISDDNAFIDAEVEINSVGNHDNLVAEIFVDNESILKDLVYLKHGKNKFSIPFVMKNIKKWWPNGMGEQKLYDVRLEIKSEDYISKISKSIGLRTIELVTENDSIGTNFFFKINGIPTFMKGVNYIPQDVFLPRVEKEDYQRILSSAVDANMNMIRVWGGGIYEEDIFYKLCDQYGLLVWQDFMFACAMYPGDNDFLNSVEEEAIYNVKRIRSHPSLALWCGNNEVLSAWENWGWKKDAVKSQSQSVADTIFKSYENIFHKILPDVINKYDSNTRYWSSSPSSSLGVKESLTDGDAHYWGVWWGKEPFSTYETKIPRFMSEFGFQSFPEFSSVKKYTNESDYNIYSEVMKSHQRSSIGNSTIEEYMKRDYKIPDSFEYFLYVSQLLQAEGIGLGMEAQRRNREICMGSLYWQLNDCWPVASWSSIDYYGKWKALHYQTKKSFSESIISFQRLQDDLKIYFVTDNLNNQKLKFRLELRDFKGKLFKSWEKDFNSNPNNSSLIHNVDLISLKNDDDFFYDKYMHATVSIGEINITEKVGFLTSFKNLNLDSPIFEFKVNAVDSFFEINFESKNLIKNLFVKSSSDYNFSDNYFDLLPNETKTIKIKRDNFHSAAKFKESLSFISLYDTF